MTNKAQAIFNQIGNKNLLLFGVHQETLVPNGVSFKLLKNEKKVTDVKIEVNMYDTYDLTFYNIRGTKVKIIRKSEDIMGEQLADAISITTKVKILY